MKKRTLLLILLAALLTLAAASACAELSTNLFIRTEKLKNNQRLTDLMFLKLYMKVEPDICLLRRIERDIVERGRDIQGIGAQYLNSVKPMFDRYIKNYIQDADVIVAGGGKNARIVDILAGYVQDRLGSAQ